MLMADTNAAIETYNDGIVNNVIWIRREYNLADGMAKYTTLPQVAYFLETGKVKGKIEQFVPCTLGTPPKGVKYKEI